MEVSSWENHLFLWAIYTMAMLNNQRVYDVDPGTLKENLENQIDDEDEEDQNDEEEYDDEEDDGKR